MDLTAKFSDWIKVLVHDNHDDISCLQDFYKANVHLVPEYPDNRV